MYFDIGERVSWWEGPARRTGKVLGYRGGLVMVQPEDGGLTAYVAPARLGRIRLTGEDVRRFVALFGGGEGGV